MTKLVSYEILRGPNELEYPMRLTTRGRYAVTAMLDLALHNDGGPVTLAGIADRQEISLTYLEQLFSRLRRRQLVRSARGPGGGYRLAKPAGDISVAEVIAAVDESVDATRCGGKKNCHGSERCLTHDLWEGLSREIEGFLSGISLGSLVIQGEKPELPGEGRGTRVVPVARIQGRRVNQS